MFFWVIALFSIRFPEIKQGINSAIIMLKQIPDQWKRTHWQRTCIGMLLIVNFWFPAMSQTNISGIINQYATIASVDTCTGIATVTSSAGFNPGDKVMILQMKGATINESNTAAFGAPVLNGAGLYETNIITAINGNQVSLMYHLVNVYDFSSRVQLVSIPQFTDALVTAPLLAQPWNGNTGGVIALEVSGTLTLQAGISADGAGFRGGQSLTIVPNDCNWLLPNNDYYYDDNNWRGSLKGEGIAATIADKEAGKGAPANGGGGGNDHNAGGGGGSHATAGGDGGRNDEPSAFGCNGNSPGIGGYALPFSSTRIYMGGGGGAGHANNNQPTHGGNGGGIIYIKAQTIVSNNQSISANGADAASSTGDGIGGGGAGGTIIASATSLTGTLSLMASGGNGGSVNCSNQDRCFGPGGGGSGGRILTDLTGVPGFTLSAQGGQPGIRTNSTNSCNNTTGGAAPGEDGVASSFPVIPQSMVPTVPAGIVQHPLPAVVCEGDPVVFTVAAIGGNLSYQWQVNPGTGFMDISDGALYSGTQSAALSITAAAIGMNSYLYRCVVSGTGCAGDIFSFPGILIVQPAANASFTAAGNGTTVTFTNTSSLVQTFLWNFGDGSTSTSFSPVHTFPSEGQYDVTLTAWTNCDTISFTMTLVVMQAPQASISTSTAQGCSPFAVSYDGMATGDITAWQWSFPGGSPASSILEDPVVVYNLPGQYDVTLIASNAAGSDTVQLPSYIEVGALPTADFSYTINGTSVSFYNLSVSADNYFWDFGDGNVAQDIHPVHDFGGAAAYTVTLTAFNACGQSVSVQELVFALPPVAYFEASTVSGCTPATVTYDAAFSGIDSWQWFFEGGTPAVSNDPAPVVVYTTSGSFDVTLIVSNAYGSDTLTQMNSLIVASAPIAYFEAIITGYDVYFTNFTQGSLNFLWDFGDNTGSELIDPNHTYGAPGTYLVTLYAFNDCDADTISQILQIQIPPVASILSNISQGCAPLTVQFNGWSPENILFWEWNFPGGDPAFSYVQNPVVTYSSPGSYSVQMTVFNGIASATLTELGYVQVGTEPTAGFSYDVSGQTVYFYNESADAEHFEWIFGDGTATDTEISPAHTYAQSGIYEVTLLALNAFCGSGVTIAVPVNYNAATTASDPPPACRLIPNPTSGQTTLWLTADIEGKPVEVGIYHLNGTLIRRYTLEPAAGEWSAGSWHWPIDMNGWPGGLYAVRLSIADGRQFIEKIEIAR